MKRRHFISGLPLLASTPVLDATGLWNDSSNYRRKLHELTKIDPDGPEFWDKIRSMYVLSEELIDLNSAGLGQMNAEVTEATHQELSNLYEIPSKNISLYYRQSKTICAELAAATNCKPEEVLLQRNATEALSAAIFGVPLQRGDEVIVGLYDYPHVYYAWRQRADRDGIVLKYVDLGKSKLTPKKIIKKYLKQLTPKTKAIQITDLINYSGCQVPTNEIINLMPAHVRYRIVDAAQSFANTTLDLSSFGATHVGASLHKWLGAPVGTGLLYVRKEYIGETWPLFASFSGTETTISKFAHVGTRNASIYPAISFALQFHQLIGTERKKNRLLRLANYLRDGLAQIKGIEILSPSNKLLQSNIVVFSHRKVESESIVRTLWKKYKIHSTALVHERINGVRFSPNVFTRFQDLDWTLSAVQKIVDKN